MLDFGPEDMDPGYSLWLARSEQERARNLFQIPPFDHAVESKVECCRAVQRKAARYGHTVQWTNDLIDTINNMYCGSEELTRSRPSRISPSKAKQFCHDHLF